MIETTTKDETFRKFSYKKGNTTLNISLSTSLEEVADMLEILEKVSKDVADYYQSLQTK